MTNHYSCAGLGTGGIPSPPWAGPGGGRKLDHLDPLASDPPAGEDDESLWSNAWSRNFWAGALSPLHYSIRVREFELNHREWRAVQGLREAAELRLFKHRRATAYIRTEVEATHLRTLFPRRWRRSMLGAVHPDQRRALAAERLHPLRFARALAGMELLRDGAGLRSWMPYVRRILIEPGRALDGPAAAALANYDDEALIRHANQVVAYFAEVNLTLWFGFYIYAQWALAALRSILERWYDGPREPAEILADLARGLPRPSALLREREAVWDLGRRIADSPRLRSDYDEHADGAFFEALAGHDEGRELRDRYAGFLAEFGQLGSADRDFVHPRRGEDPSLDYRAFGLVMRADPGRSPRALAAAQREVRARTVAEVSDSIAGGPFGGLRLAAFRAVLGYVEEFWTLRDDQKAAAERVVMAKKRVWTEIGARLAERGAIAAADDYFFLSADECVALLRGEDAPAGLEQAIAARRAAFEAALGGGETPPLHLRGGRPEAERPPGEALAPVGSRLEAESLCGGVHVGRARIAHRLADLGRLRRGDVLVCPSTDPGWSTAFLVAGALVVEGGGPLSFPGRMSREHEVPAAVLAEATAAIADGATVEVDGDRGVVTVLERRPDQAHD